MMNQDVDNWRSRALADIATAVSAADECIAEIQALGDGEFEDHWARLTAINKNEGVLSNVEVERIMIYASERLGVGKRALNKDFKEAAERITSQPRLSVPIDLMNLPPVSSEPTLDQQLLNRYFYVKDQDMFYDRLSRKLYPPRVIDRSHLAEFDDPQASNRIFSSPHGIEVESQSYFPGAANELIERGGFLYANTWTPGLVSSDFVLRAVTDEEASVYLDHLAFIIPDTDVREHTLDLFAFMLQEQGQKANHHLLLVGQERTGKDTLLEPLRLGLGLDNVSEPGGEKLKTPFQDYAREKKLIIVQEVMSFAGKAELANDMKPLLAAPPDELALKIKCQDDFIQPNLLAFVFMSNEPESALHISSEGGRYFCYESAAVKREPSYYDELWRWLGSGGTETVVHWLMGRDLTKFNPKAPAPETNYRLRLKVNSRHWLCEHLDVLIADAESWWECKGDRSPPLDNPFVPDRISTAVDVNKALLRIKGGEQTDPGDFYQDIHLALRESKGRLSSKGVGMALSQLKESQVLTKVELRKRVESTHTKTNYYVLRCVEDAEGHAKAYRDRVVPKA